MTAVILPSVKTAISVPDEVFDAAEELAERLGVSRSQLFSQAVAEYVANRRATEVTKRLNEVYSEVEAKLDPVLARIQRKSLPRDW